MSFPYRRDPLGIVKHTMCFSVKSSSRKSFNYGLILLPPSNVQHELSFNDQPWPSYCLCSVDSFAFGGTLKKGLLCLVLCFLRGKDVIEPNLWSVFFRTYLTNVQKVSLSLSAFQRGGENWVRGMSLLYLPSNLLHKTYAGLKSERDLWACVEGHKGDSPESTAAASTWSLPGLDSKWLWKATEGLVLARGHESCRPQLSDSLFALGISPIWTENLFSFLISKGTFLNTSSCVGVNWEQ